MIVRLDVGTCTVCGGTWEGGMAVKRIFIFVLCLCWVICCTV